MREKLNSVISLLGIFLFLTTGTIQAQSPVNGNDAVVSGSNVYARSEVAESYLDSVVTNTSLREKIGQLFIVPAYGEFTSQYDRRYKQLEELIRKYHIGGIIFMRGDIYGQAVLTNKLQQLSETPLWITQDMEFGAAMRVSGTTRFTPAMGVAASGNKRNAFMMGKITALEAKSLGVHQIFAPVLDVNNNPENPVINVRSFSEDPEIVAEFGTAFVQGAQSEGILATAKHFPGHGDTDQDSHRNMPVVNHDFVRLDTLELVPFRAAINGGINSVMSAHIAFPKLSGQDLIPGTLDSVIINDILTDSLDFKGLVITDGLEMGGITTRFSPGRAVVRALNAGVDIMLISPDVETAIVEVEEAVERGEITEARIDQSFRKFMAWKYQSGLFNSNNQIDIDRLDGRINTPYNQSVANKVARESITLLKNNDNILPVNPSEYPRILMLAVDDNRSGNSGSDFARELRSYHPDISYHVYDNRTSEEDKRRIMAQADRADLIMIGSFISLRTGQSAQFNRAQRSFLNRLLRKNKKSVLIAFGNPYVLSELSNTDSQILAWYNSDQQVEATAAALFGGSRISGKLPIQIPDMYPVGHGIDIPQSSLRFGDPEDVDLNRNILYEIDTIIEDAVRDSVFPGAVVGIVKDGVLAYHQAYGYHDYQKTEKVRPSDVYDLASISKAVGTTTAVMRLVDEGKIDLEDRVADYIKEFDRGDRKDVRIRHLLLHESGLPPFRVYVDSLKEKDAILDAIRNEPLTYETGTDYVYSDLGMILLATIIEEITGSSLDTYLREEFYFPIGMYSAFYNPAKNARWLLSRIPPTEMDTVYDRGLVKGEVHDERAWYLGGVAGHAGLFASVTDLAKYSTMILNEGVYGGKRYLSSEVVRSFTSRRSEISGRGYGFDRKSNNGFTTAGQLASTDTFGHLGFTGTSLWIDREKNMTVILLTNRTYPHRSYGKLISRIRAAVADKAFSAINTK
ncbi:glycoside hydrolase family 3 N-terminal domain-containing protein [Balneola sp. MJW-20]|uniref:glycoside hydrolase family 3 N-terminal domain-containing protein n=1 Tax=Gracilimonas aurantiaca TaxID=3234185 RepID=UPI0034653B52